MSPNSTSKSTFTPATAPSVLKGGPPKPVAAPVASHPAATAAVAAKPVAAAVPSPVTAASVVASLKALFTPALVKECGNDPYSHAYFDNAATRMMLAWGNCGPTPQYAQADAYQPAALRADNVFAQIPVLPQATALLNAAFNDYASYIETGPTLWDARTVLLALSDLCKSVQPG